MYYAFRHSLTFTKFRPFRSTFPYNGIHFKTKRKSPSHPPNNQKVVYIVLRIINYGKTSFERPKRVRFTRCCLSCGTYEPKSFLIVSNSNLVRQTSFRFLANRRLIKYSTILFYYMESARFLGVYFTGFRGHVEIRYY